MLDIKLFPLKRISGHKDTIFDKERAVLAPIFRYIFYFTTKNTGLIFCRIHFFHIFAKKKEEWIFS
jgi:hypothetical protein